MTLQRTLAARVFDVQENQKLRDRLLSDVSRMTTNASSEPPASKSTTLSMAFRDLVSGWRQNELWLQLGWQDIKQRYRRSTLGPLWITVATGVMAIALGLLYSMLFQQDLATFLPHVAVGLIIWGFISGCIKEGAEVFIDNEGLIKQLPSALSVHVYRLTWRQLIIFAHNVVIIVILFLIFPPPLNWTVTLIVPALALYVVNSIWVTIVFGILTTGAGPHSGDANAGRSGFDAQVLEHVHAWPSYALFALTLALVVVAWAKRLPVRGWASALLAIELVQITVGLYQARNGLPEFAVGTHMVLASLTAATMTVLVLRLKHPLTPRS